MNENIKIVKTWIDFSFNIHIYNNVGESAKDMLLIILNTQKVLNSKNEIIGFVNPYLNINTFMSYGGEPVIMRGMTRDFNVIIKENPIGGYIISIFPNKLYDQNTNDYVGQDARFYSIKNFYQDLPILIESQRLIVLRHNIQIHPNISYTPFIEEFENEKHAGIQQYDGLFHIKYLIKDRIESIKENPNLDKIISGEMNILETINFISSKESNSEWSTLVKKFIPQKEKGFFEKLFG